MIFKQKTRCPNLILGRNPVIGVLKSMVGKLRGIQKKPNKSNQKEEEEDYAALGFATHCAS